ncbi:Protein FAM98B [Gracilariopsis chorda]|uniref:Protein FAM98B n=1 Tax=Gracilariopsis chorda TaxID=448386 RepID=A0A2V3IHV5_9FLOR|nr:Protein FAM98B [Gracilariopsis chorda]|eukprot:PXF41676.1 Protein FAM98B [Gracilariopsis chorda]
MALSVEETAEILGVPLAEDDEQHKIFVSSILSELDPNSTITDTLPDVGLRSVGFEGDPKDRAAVSQFLLSTLQTHRILQHDQTQEQHDPKDELLTDAVSRMCASLEIPPSQKQSFEEADVANIIKNIVSRIEAEASQDTLHARLGSPLVPQTLSADQISTCTEILDKLQKEHVVRRNMLLTRFNVTLSTFARSNAVKKHQKQFESLKLRAEQLERISSVELYEALAARQWLLADPPVAATVDADEVKSFLMGQVPDRGGRLAVAGSMPHFRGRVPTWQERNPGKGKGKGKGHKKKRKA